jgi:hypothetical protein
MERHATPHAGGGAGIADSDFFAMQSAYADRLLATLESGYETSGIDRPRRMHALRRAIHARARQDPESARRDRATLAEVIRLGHFTRDYYASATLAQEHIAESLQQTRLALLQPSMQGKLTA